jgi:2',3'-cyclic-nucleotide 2'-phosphodiesterase (5'-nucleotidase family)
MRTLLAAIAGLVATVGAIAIAGAADSDPVVGTWLLNASKSTFAGAQAPKSQTRTYTQSGPSITLVIKTVGADGKEATVQTTYKLDGNDYPVSGSQDFDSLSAKQVNPHTATFTLKKAGKAVGRTTRTVSHDGKILTSKSDTTTTKGEKVESVLVFDRQ